ncbi:hypothetical protein C666_12735 [Thauera linaloolentis 47Lol = DSM 12138]|uniref:Uncharacterized protein n=1 Tax=Thauera linaloolentis (strain DSM 12138 / JCM 21573 / CCUG 41526 / CIP 105981 / IAM 15112 / NBRC 102519 / 47Lol) TaxID=1123367 RepID=N6YW36_THAL4|nr:hypothetical protein C666_12735 [Thauera linaloolentis 47Lol = DSM 12138]
MQDGRHDGLGRMANRRNIPEWTAPSTRRTMKGVGGRLGKAGLAEPECWADDVLEARTPEGVFGTE